jgi:chromate transporter
MFILWALSYAYVSFGTLSSVGAVLYGLKPAVLAIIAAALLRIGRKTLKNKVLWTISALAFVAVYFFRVPFPLLILFAALVGFIGQVLWGEKFVSLQGPPAGCNLHTKKEGPAGTYSVRSSIWRSLRVCGTCLTLWWIPLLGLAAWVGHDHVLVAEGIFFSKAAMVTFGGAYAVLPYVSDEAVQTHGWLTASQMLDGLGLAETTPGPLIMVLQFVGFLGAWNHPGGLPRLFSATMGAIITTWTTFVPCFLWIFLGAPHIEKLRGNQMIAGALSAITAAVVGVILNLAIWFGLHVLSPSPPALDWFALFVSSVAFLGLLKWNWGVIPLVLGSGAIGFVLRG